MIKNIIAFIFIYTASVMAQCGGASPSWTALSAAQTDVVNCITAASPGDTLHIPSTSGSVTWPSTVVDNKGLNWVGAGSSGAGATEINYGGYAALSIQVSSPAKFSVSNMWFNRSSNVANSDAIVVDGNTTPANGWKIFNNQFTGYGDQSGANDIQINSPTYGVIFDNVYNDAGLESISIYMLLAANQTGPWSTPLTSIVGTTNIVFVEGNIWNLSNAQTWNSFHAITSGRGSRYEARYNTTIKNGTGFASVYDAHGYCGTYESSGSQYYDIHHNLITDNGGVGWYGNIRGGNGLVHDNAFSGTYSTGQNLNFEEYRADQTDSVTYNCYVQATNSPNLYPLIYQTTEMYMFNNGSAGYSIDPNLYESTYLQVGRDIHLNAPTNWTYTDSICPNSWTGLTGSCNTSSAGISAYNVTVIPGTSFSGVLSLSGQVVQ